MTYNPHQRNYPPRQPHPQQQSQRNQQPYQGNWPPSQHQSQAIQQWQQPPYPQPYPQQAAPPSAALIIILSFLIPGLGSLYGRSYVHGAIILGAFLLSALLILAGIGILLVPCVWIWGMIAACVLAGRR